VFDDQLVFKIQDDMHFLELSPWYELSVICYEWYNDFSYFFLSYVDVGVEEIKFTFFLK
jgi:hypothetical protein